MNMENRRFIQRDGSLRSLGIYFVIAAVTVILAVVSERYFTFLDAQLFKERSKHIVEFTDKASEIVDSVIEYSWRKVFTCEYILKNSEISSTDELFDAMSSMSEIMDGEDSLVLAIDGDSDYYSSDRNFGHFMHPELLTGEMERMQQVVTELPHKNDRSFFIFMERMKTPLMLGDHGSAVTHLAVAVDMEAMREKITVKGFEDQCYTYLLNESGKRLYKYTYADNFIEVDDVLSAFKDYTIKHGATYENFIKDIEAGRETALEFEFTGQDGAKHNWFVANASVTSENWQMLLFIPAKVLGADTSLLLKRTIRFFMTASAAILVLAVIAVAGLMVSRSDRRLVRQKDEANQLLRTAVEEANSANQAKSDFLSYMSHDIRTPINGIMGMTEIALKNIGNQDKIFDCLKKISGSSQHLLGLINDVLDMSRIESGKTKINHESFDLRTCLDNCASIIGGQLTTRDIKLVREFGEFKHPLLIGDELHLRQVFINILGNSVKFTPDGGKIFFRACEVESADGRALFRFTLEDTGIGMKEDFLPHIFDAFSQEDDGTRTTYKGTGLGMAITKKFVDLMEGEIKVESKVNEGTKFVIEIAMDIDQNAKAGEKAGKARIDLTGMKVLLVEDIELNLEIAQNILEVEGVVVTPAMNGQEAVDAFAGNPEGTFDLIIMDIMMPVMDGITATKTIRAMARPDASKIPIIAMTANAFEEDIRSTREAGMNVHLSKPIDVDMLLKTLSRFYPGGEEQKNVIELPGLKILLADDVELNLEIAKTILEDEGAIVTAVENGQEAVDAFRRYPEGTFDVILMDVHMPVMDGMKATKMIRGLERGDAAKIPIFAMTADVYEEDMEKTKAAGMNGHLTKPLNLEKMMWMLSGYREDV